VQLSRSARIALRVAAGAGFAVIYVPLLLVVVNSLNPDRSASWPPPGLTPHWWSVAWHNSGAREALWTSVKAGLGATAIALVLGTLIGTSFAFYGGQRTGLEALSAQILELDQALAQYGPETKPARERLKQATQKAYDAFWGGGDADPALLSVADPMAAFLATKVFLASLTPTTEAQKQALASANALAGQIEHGRIMMSLQIATPPVSAGLLTVLVIWAVILFFSMGLFAQSNGLVLSAMTFGALCVAFAVFLILALGLPYTGMFRVSPAALQAAMDNIDK
jgi:hypothetical protein